MNGGVPRNLLAEDAHPFRAIHQPPAERALRLEAGDQYAALGASQVVAQMVLDAAGIAHAARGNDDGAGANLVEGDGLVHAADEVQIRQAAAG